MTIRYIAVLVVLVSCSNPQVPKGKWINISVEKEHDLGSIDFNDQTITIRLADGRIVSSASIDRQLPIRFQFPSEKDGFVLCRIIENKQNQIFVATEVKNRVDTISLLPYSKFQGSDWSVYDLQRLLVDKLWKNEADTSSSFQFLPDSTVIKCTRSDNGLNYYRFGWQILHFDSLFFLKTISVTPDVSLISVKSTTEIETWSPKENVSIKLTASPASADRIKLSSALLGQWRLVPDEDPGPLPFDVIEFDEIMTVKNFTVTTGLDEIEAGEWDVDYMGHLIVLNFNDGKSRAIEIKALSDVSVFCVDGFCHKYKRIK